jgi:hypothetical protein
MTFQRHWGRSPLTDAELNYYLDHYGRLWIARNQIGPMRIAAGGVEN